MACSLFSFSFLCFGVLDMGCREWKVKAHTNWTHRASTRLVDDKSLLFASG